MENIDSVKNIIKDWKINKAVLSNPAKKGDGIVFKSTVERVCVKEKDCFRISDFIDKKVLHRIEECDNNIIIDIMSENGFKNCDISGDINAVILKNKKNMFTVTGVKKGCEQYKAKQHNREKNRIIKEGQKIGWMCELGLMSDDGKIRQKNSSR